MTEVNAVLEAKIQRMIAKIGEEQLASICYVWDENTRQSALFTLGNLEAGNAITTISRIIDIFNLDVDGVLFSIKLSKAYRQEN